MDTFSSVLSAGGSILQFLDACSVYSDEAKSLKTRFDWDIYVLKVINEYFIERRSQKLDEQSISEVDKLLEQTASYLEEFMTKVQKTLWKIERKGWLRDGVKQIMWIKRRAELKEMEQEMFDWTKRFDLRVLGLPQELRSIIPSTSAGSNLNVPDLVKSNIRLQEFLALASTAKRTRAQSMLLENPNEVASQITRRGDVSFQPLQYGNEQIIFASRRVPAGYLPGSREFLDMTSDMGELAAALNCLDPVADVRLLKIEYFFYHVESNQFLFAQIPPYPVASMMTLEKVISGDPFPDVEALLNDRLRLAYKLAEAVFFLHAAGFVHKNITSTSVVALRRDDTVPGDIVSDIDDCYLMGFDLVRGTEATTVNEGAVEESNEQTSIWDFKVFQHPHRLRGDDSLRYIKTYDVYSLGVVLFEIGVWEPLGIVAKTLTRTEPENWPREISKILPLVGARAGDKYQSLVEWCLNLNGKHVVKDSEFVQKVLDPLEDIVKGLSKNVLTVAVERNK